MLPFRETFAAVFFVGLGLLIDVRMFFATPLQLLAIAIALIIVKGVAAAIAVHATGLGRRASLGVGVGLAHVGEFAFVLGRVAADNGLVQQRDYSQFAAVAFLSLMVTPPLLKLGLRLVGGDDASAARGRSGVPASELDHAVVIGAGPVGKQVASYLETQGADVTMVDRSPVNLYPFAQAGMQTVAGDASDLTVLRAADGEEAAAIVVCVSSDESAERIVKQTKLLNPSARLLVRCRFETSVRKFKQLGADFVVSEEQQAYSRLIGELRRDDA